MKSRAIGAFLIALLGLAGLSLPVLAQTTGDLAGVVSDGTGAPLPGVAVEIRSSSLIGTRSVVTDGAGRYRFPALPPGTYLVTASLSGFTKVERNNVRVSLGATATVNISLSVSTTAEVVVTGEAPVVDTANTTIGTTATSEAIQRLPLGRNFTAIATTVAGTGTDVSGGITVYGATGLENSYIVDGINTTGIKTGIQTKQLNNEFIQEVEVKTGGYEAEYGRVLGGTVNVITKSGGNEFRGNVFGYYDSDSLAAGDSQTADRHQVYQGEYTTPTRYDLGFGLGGYMMKDRVWFFAAYNRTKSSQDIERILAVNRDANKTPVFTTNVDETTRNLFSGKLTFRLGEANTIAAS
ncbi:MAG: carboxypeptidase regulatory-like domain-containing protein, partial [Nitrospira sp.]|nr:carboxypeptidase regulatory-like domain-containing protein [Nitrospira sp.]